jgi:hypothetical protein
VSVTVEVADGEVVQVSVTVEVEVGGSETVAVEVAVGRVVGVRLGTQPPCIILSDKVSESTVLIPFSERFACLSEASAALNDCQVNGINKPTKSARIASKISHFLLFRLSSIKTS